MIFAQSNKLTDEIAFRKTTKIKQNIVLLPHFFNQITWQGQQKGGLIGSEGHSPEWWRRHGGLSHSGRTMSLQLLYMAQFRNSGMRAPVRSGRAFNSFNVLFQPTSIHVPKFALPPKTQHRPDVQTRGPLGTFQTPIRSATCTLSLITTWALR